MEANRSNNQEQNSHLFKQLIFRYIPYWPLFLILLLVSIAGAWIYLRYTTPYYESTARILIKDEKKGSEDAKAIEELNMLSSKKIIENEIEVIQSRTLLYEVVKNLGLYAPVFEQGNIRKVSAFSRSPIRIEVQDLDRIVRRDKISFNFDDKRSVVIIGQESFPLSQWVNTPYGTLKFIPAKNNPGKQEAPLFFALVDPKEVVSDIQNKLKVQSASKQSSILNLSLRDEEPKKGEAILNELLTVYNKATIQDKNSLAVNTLSFVEERLKNVEQDLDRIEKKNQEYKSSRGAIDISEQGRLFLQNVSSNDQKLSDINMQLAVLSQVEDYVRTKNGTEGIVPSTLGVADPMLSQLVSTLYTTELEYESLKKTTAENNPAMIALADRIGKIKPGIVENIETQRKSLLASRNNLNETNKSYSSILQSIPEKERALIDINREQTIKNGIYGFLLQKREETALSHASTVSDSRIIDNAASSNKPVSPKRKVVYLTALLFALFAAIGTVTAKENLSRKIMFRHEIENLTTHPIIGEIVSESSSDPIVIGSNRKTFIAEQFRKLRTTLTYVGINSFKKRILVTSAISGEGKSFIAANLALSLALTGKRVVLVDCDLNNPSLNKKLSVANKKGITEYLLGTAETEDIVTQTALNNNLFFIATGILPENPSELIMNGRIEVLLNQLDGMFDYIVVDTAPVIPVTDAYILSPFCDATLFVVRHKYTPKVFVQRMDENNKMNKLTNLAIVFNGIQSRGFGNRNYGYGYGYGYIHDDKKSHRVDNTTKA